ncbi:hypothetical protein POVCU2_0005390 [Plasmodium ovale curtisi]|uniref:Uncharacterized protein n=1 Tax=Plasmodium ovale curtisi TaxID=864141 RepID=A0A1A8VMD4_PLAOA|nr:hypothetical protein POVCU2_0005390 [Plasmodium ovale curtisi]SBS81111.1 hypothetical protein POVCU1_004740 [Plasmodium ovale curtisi]
MVTVYPTDTVNFYIRVPSKMQKPFCSFKKSSYGCYDAITVHSHVEAYLTNVYLYNWVLPKVLTPNVSKSTA